MIDIVPKKQYQFVKRFLDVISLHVNRWEEARALLPSFQYNEDTSMELEVHNITTNSPVQDTQRYAAKTKKITLEQGKTSDTPEDNTNNTATYTKEELESYLKKVFKNYPLLNRRLKFYINRDLNQVVVKVVDSNTDKVIREIPPQELQNLRVRIQEALRLLFDIEI